MLQTHFKKFLTAIKNTGIDRISLVLAPIISIYIIFFVDLVPGKPQVTNMAAIAILMAIFWMTEAIPLGITALLPVILYPLLGIMNGKIVANVYFNHIIFLFIGGFIVAIAMEKWNLHKRIALVVLSKFSNTPKYILLGFIVVTAFLSMWISNTATSMMMVPICIAVIYKLEETLSETSLNRYAKGIFLGVAYSASIGGIATLIGTPSNLIFSRIFSIQFPNAPEITFSKWFVFALPISLVFLAILWVYLTILFCPKEKMKIKGTAFKEQLEKLGKINFEEKSVLMIFTSMALLWLFRADLNLGFIIIPGWSRIFTNPKFFNDGTVAMAMAVLLFLIPSKIAKENQYGRKRVMDWETINTKLPWNIVFLFGGGFALAKGFIESGFSTWLANQLSSMSNLHPLLIVIIICILIAIFTALTSNTATVQLFLPILAAMAIAINVNPLLLMLPATLSGSCAFMLPVATPPNAIVFGSGKLRISDMVKFGFFLNVVGVILITIYLYFFGSKMIGIDLMTVPTWIN